MEDDDKDDWSVHRRRRAPFGPWGLPDIDEMMKEVERAFSVEFKDLEKELPRNLVRESKIPGGGVRKEIGPFVYGYSVTIGPDGKPVVREFGNVRREEGKAWKSIQDKREPLVDVVTSSKDVRVIAEMPGVRKEDINVTVNENTMIISVEHEDRGYYKKLDLPGVVDPKRAISAYNNGVLEVTIPLKTARPSGVRVRVE
ncbi:MAG: Hsp20/alpha crystallin family protein [Nitrososphaerota archaeon]|jgi:HSP20 family protein|nr:Hsp20/alpha crystallin family protein [Nitrososphaerota archaeon]MDG6903410.1 Hsp20/alpha crystallin family protein [Nitrososphaerota archaeon]MDG6913011.1 Hsp20/alpha crystallin family protein [Nitrososphaerota archaeon]MDG6940790.1 Hsp20/alpha crystallin family protein [Nitrososphaerota archaeon]MDG6945239.1 Hsp20/alpha crystallin family protein [Nitrososphaerota archaeon]